MIRIMAKEFLGRGIRVNGILPAGVATQMEEKKGELLDGITGESADDQRQAVGSIPVSNIVSQILFLLSDESRYTTGSLIEINAGMI